jgi:lipoprotein-anchoring transpeptidase ErfK/SrfK
VRRAFALGVAGVVFAIPTTASAGGEAVTLRLTPQTAWVGTTVRFSGTVTPHQADVPVRLYRVTGTTRTLVAQVLTTNGGAYRKDLRPGRPGRFLARATIPASGADPTVDSAPIDLRIRPRLRTRFAGRAAIGGALSLRGKLTPVVAGVLKRTIRGVTRTVRVDSHGYFRIKLSTQQAGRLRVILRLRGAPGYATVTKVRRKKLALPRLGIGSRGTAVRVLERQLDARQFAIRNRNKKYGLDTAQAVIAFQKVHGRSRTGRVGPSFWRLLARSGTPKARVRRGNHIEISKTKQVLYEVRKGKVVNVLHTSTGATGNTPVGTWRVYSKVPGFNGVGMYYSLFFLRGFAIHGYHSVPSYPASHGCARLPIWAAPGLYSRWGYGSRIIVFA